MLAPLIALTLSFSTNTGADTTDARHVVREAIHAVEGDSIARSRSRWSGRLHADSANRAALLGLATLARLTYDYPASDSLYRRLFGEDSLHPDSYAVYARLGRAWSLEERGQSDAAGEEFARARDAARAAANPTAEAEALIGLAFARGPTAGVAAAKAILDTAGPLIPATALDLQAERGWRRAMIRALLGEPGATNEAAASVALARRSGELRVRAQAVRGLARVLDWRGEEDSALTAFEEAEQLFRQARDRSWLAVTLMNKGNLLRKRGDLGETVKALRLTTAEGELSHNLWAVASAHTGLGVVALQLNDFPEASRQLSQAVTMFEAQGDRSSAMNARSFLPLVALADRDFATARRQTIEGLEFYRGTGEISSQFAALRTLFTIAIREHDWAGAERNLADERALLPKLDGPQWEVTLTFDQGRLARARGELAPAERAFHRFLAGLDSADHPARYDARLWLADIYAERRDLDATEREATSAWDELERWRATLSDRELRLLAFQVTRSEYQASPAGASDQRAGVARVLAALAAGGRAPRAFELAERRRARDLMDRMARAEGLRTHASGTATDAHVAPFTTGGPLSAAALAALIPDDRTAILEYVTGASGAPTTLFVVTKPNQDGVTVRAHVLASADSLIEPLARFLARIRSEADVATLARTLGGMLLDSALAELGGRATRLIMVPDGPLHRVPWDLLRLPDGRYVVQQYSVSVTPSAAILAALWRHPRAGHTSDNPVRLLAFGDPAYGAAALDSTEALPRLEGSGREARLVARYSPEADVRLRKEASAAYLEHAQLDPYRIIHFATHALVDERSSARTVLALAPDSSNSGNVGPGDLAALRLDADLVVLSGCRTAGGVLVEGEGVQGLTAPLIQAGARSVVASQWRIADRGTIPFVRDFYEALAESLPVGDALRQAKLEALHRGVPPREWAAFTTVGDPLVSVRLREPRPEINCAVILAAALAFGAAGFVFARRSLSRSATG
ncbi:MAG TPA: CHAT domain-containing protein [Gemmatimonadales bacterium]|jgi:CHAT domain-containing protein